MQYPKYTCSIRSINVVEMQYPKYHDDDEDNDDDDEDAVEEEEVQVNKYVCIISVPGEILFLSPAPKGGVPFAAHIVSRFS